MDVNTGRLIEMGGHDLIDMQERLAQLMRDNPGSQWEEVPSDLHHAARVALRGEKEGKVSLTSGGKLSRWAAMKRKTARKLRKAGCR